MRRYKTTERIEVTHWNIEAVKKYLKEEVWCINIDPDKIYVGQVIYLEHRII